MSNYIAINIGPIVKTICLARRPRELWAASYMFSCLAEYIMNNVIKAGYTIVSPAHPVPKLGIGLYPDRIYVKDVTLEQGRVCVDKAMDDFSALITLDKCYFNTMIADCVASKDCEALKILNARLDLLEMNVMASDKDQTAGVRIVLNNPKALYGHAGLTTGLKVDTLAEIAAREKEETPSWKEFQINCLENNSENPFSILQGIKSYHKYFCVVQADGDNVGKALASMTDPDIKNFSSSLLDFGRCAKEEIENYGGFPVYAGGDDLLFLAPVVGKDQRTIFQLLEALNDKAFAPVINLTKAANTSLSFGLEICYYKHPLYEALAAARNLLYAAKGFKGSGAGNLKNAIAVRLEKHSGESFEAVISRNVPDLWEKYMTLIDETKDGNTVSAVSHKLRMSDVALKDILDDPDHRSSRLKAYFKLILESDSGPYYSAVEDMVPTLYDMSDKEGFAQILYNLLRIAKFIKGEDPIDE